MLQRRAAHLAVGPSTVRGQGPGVVKAAREFLTSRLDLARFGTGSEQRFKRELDRATERMLQALPPRGRRWGVARKVLNVYLRDCLYTCYLRVRYGLERAERFLELPLDSFTAEGLRDAVGGLPAWRGVKHLTPQDSARYQMAASELAERRGFERVHLDAELWTRAAQRAGLARRRRR